MLENQKNGKWKHTCSLCDSILPGQHCTDKQHEHYFKIYIKTVRQNISSRVHKKWKYDSFKTGQKQFYSYHLMVYLRLGWLTVLSSRNIVEHELYFRLIGPGWCCNTNAPVLAQRAKSTHPSISISVHAGTDHELWWQPRNVGHLKANKPILPSQCWCLRWEHAGLAYMKDCII